MSKIQDPPKVQDEDTVAELPVHAVDSMPVFHSVSDHADVSAASMGRQDSFTCARRSYFGETIVVRIMSTPLTA